MKEILQRSLSPSTWTQYGRVWSTFEEFNKKIMDVLSVLPVLPFHIILFLTSLHQKDLSSSTIRSAGSAMAFLHKLHGLPDPMEAFIVRKFLQGLSNMSTSQDIRLPITRGILNRLIRSLSVMGFSLYKVLMLRALYLTLFHGFLRIGEATSKTSSSSPIQYKDLTFSSSEAVIILHQFKHSKEPHRVGLSSALEEELCPVRTLQQFCVIRGSHPGPLFASPGGCLYTCGSARDDLRSVLSFCGLDTARYKSHSFRIGAASDAALRGFSDAQIRLMGRWRSDAFRQYIRLPY